ncbi:echinoderm microtubule-associated protein-like 1 [Engraulis encrasicolus]|uniref:echinoderm microtubule-associated protein-like 1 n=1 Tax=Engraulis encrasicolus TaxID=184585 RepID=UPI002FCE9CF6
MEDTHMEDLDQADAMTTGATRYHGDSLLLPPETDFMTDDHSSAASGMDVSERLTFLEQRVQQQEDEIQLLKLALADVLKRLNLSEETQADLMRKTTPSKATRPASLSLSGRPSTAPAKKSSSGSTNTLASSGGNRNRGSVSSVKDSPSTPSKPRTGSASSTTTPCKKLQDRKPAATGTGNRRVIHCKVTMQIYLSRLSKRTGSTEDIVTAAPVPSSHTEDPPPKSPPPKLTVVCDRIKPPPLKPSPQKSPAFPLPLYRASLGSSPCSPMETPPYKSPIKSPGQYFQICY